MNRKENGKIDKKMEIRAPDWWCKGPPKKGIYDSYQYTRWEVCKYAGIGLVISGMVGKLFYNRIWIMFLFLPFVYGYLKEKAKEKQEERKKQLEKEFRDLLVSVQASLQAGLSVENSFLAAHKDMCILYGRESDILYELSQLQKKLTCNISIEAILADFGKRSQCQNILEFSQVFQIAKRSGGNMKEVIKHTVQVLEDNMAVRNELEIVLAQKKLEQKIMTAMPILIMIYLSVTSKGFFDVMYQSLSGIMVMTGSLIGYFTAYQFMKKIINIKV